MPAPLPPRPLYDFALGLRRRRFGGRTSSTRLADCANLAVAAVGSSSLTTLLGREVGGSLGPNAADCPSPGAMSNHGLRHGHPAAASPFMCRHVHHRHQLLPAELHAHGARCFVATLRDPANRISTGFAFELSTFYTSYAGTRHLMSMRNSKAGLYEVKEYVNALMDPGRYPVQHKYALSVFNASVGPNVFTGRGMAGQEVFAGNPFLVPQARYVAAAGELDDSELHLVCIEHFDQDWNWFLDRFAELANRPRSATVRANNGSRAHFGAYGTYLNEQQKNFVREVMFPEDTALWRHVCNSSAERRARLAGGHGGGSSSGDRSSGGSNALGKYTSRPAV